VTALDVTSGQIAELVYRAGAATWDLGESQPAVRQLIALGALNGTVLDAGCGTGWHAIDMARAGCSVTGLDISPTAIHRARTNAKWAGATVDFKQRDVTTLEGFDGKFDTVLDSKLLDNLDTNDRQRYLAALHRATKPGARLFMYGFGPGEINGVHNHLLAEPDFETVLPANGFTIDYVGATTYQLRVDGYQSICSDCPPWLPDGRQHIPMIEVHATRLPNGH
jgi:SAM-dependent methyltransferase